MTQPHDLAKQIVDLAAQLADAHALAEQQEALNNCLRRRLHAEAELRQMLEKMLAEISTMIEDMWERWAARRETKR